MRRVSGDMSDLKYGTTDQHVTKELKVSYPMMIWESTDITRNWLKLAIDS